MRFALLSRLSARQAYLWQELLSLELAGGEIELGPPHGLLEPADRAGIEILFTVDPAPGQLGGWPDARLIQSLWAGVDGLLADPSLPADLPIARLIDPAMATGIAECALTHVLSLHRQLHRYRAQANLRIWQQLEQPPASERTVGIMGLGKMGAEAARMIAKAGFKVRGWSSSGAPLPDVEVFAGDDRLPAFLKGTEILVNLLPLTPRTTGLIDRNSLGLLPAGASLVNLGRGAHVVVADLLGALDDGRLDHAVLDVFPVEPLPPDDPLWEHPSITILPHVAATTDPHTAARIASRNVRRFLSGEHPEGLVRREAGY